MNVPTNIRLIKAIAARQSIIIASAKRNRLDEILIEYVWIKNSSQEDKYLIMEEKVSLGK